MSGPRFQEPGGHTAYGGILDYRLGKLAQRGLIHGDWLDLGCADGYYTVGLAERGASTVVGFEPIAERVEHAEALPHPDNVSFIRATAEQLPFVDNVFNGVLLNEVLEHVSDERRTLEEIERVLQPCGHLALFSPNRWFPFEGHGARLDENRVLLNRPVPLMPWLPGRLTSRVATARNYWPRDLCRLVLKAGMDIVECDWALAQFDQYQWLPKRLADQYRAHIDKIERSPVARFFAVSTLVIARCRQNDR